MYFQNFVFKVSFKAVFVAHKKKGEEQLNKKSERDNGSAILFILKFHL